MTYRSKKELEFVNDAMASRLYFIAWDMGEVYTKQTPYALDKSTYQKSPTWTFRDLGVNRQNTGRWIVREIYRKTRDYTVPMQRKFWGSR